jgi:hypothetical protein
MNSRPLPDRIVGAPAMRLPHQRPGADRGLSRGGPTAAEGVEPAFTDLFKILPKLPDLFSKFF